MPGVPIPDDYVDVCAQHSVMPADREVWRVLADVLPPRGIHWWWLDPRDDSGDPAWCFGLAGACVLAVTPLDGRYLLYVAEHDDEMSFATVDELVAWLDANEHRYEEFTEVQQRIIDDIGPAIIDKWRDDGMNV